MEASRSSENIEDVITVSSELPKDIKAWNKDHVRQWLLRINVDEEDAEILYNEKITGASLLLLEMTDLTQLQLSMNAKKLIIHNRDLLKQKTQQLNNLVCSSSKPYPFKRFNAAYRYQENSILDVTETGSLDLIQPCHEFKGFTNTTEENRMNKFTYEVIRFAAACLNSRTNGTIHFGVADKPHGQILGVRVEDKESFNLQQSTAIKKHFKQIYKINYAQKAASCIFPPRFVEVLKTNRTSTGRHVIEVDIEPSFTVCKNYYFYTYDVNKGTEETQPNTTKEGKSKTSFFVRLKKGSTDNIYGSKDYETYIANMQQLSQERKEAEEKHFSDVKTSVQGSKLCEMITGGSHSLDKSNFAWYVVVANKSHPVQLNSLCFLPHMNLMAVLDFDPESAKNGLHTIFEDRITNDHSPAQYKITEEVENIANRLKLTRNISWVFCNGGVGEETSSDDGNWLTEKGSSVRDVISFLCRKDVLEPKRFLIIFLLLSDVNDGKDPLLETFSMFLQELKGTNQILSICENEISYTYWKDHIEKRYGCDISQRCIHELSFAEISGTVLSLWSDNRKSKRFLPCGGGSKVELSKKTEESLDMLSILCANQCDGGNEDKKQVEESFYRGGKVSWWNFYFSEHSESKPFIKRDRFDYVVNTIIPDRRTLKTACEVINILHLPGCGGTTLAMHVLWTLKDKFRCAVLKGNTIDHAGVVARQVVDLLTYEAKEQSTRLPVLLMIDDFEDISEVKELQMQILQKCVEQKIFFKSPQVIILNCMRAESFDYTEATDDTVSIGNNLSENEQKQLEQKFNEIKQNYSNIETFYGFMILKENFSKEYIQRVVKNTLKGFNFQDKHAQLFAVLILLNVYCKNARLSVSACEEFLAQHTRAHSESCKAKERFGKFSTLLTRSSVDCNVVFEGVRVIHSSIAQQSLEVLNKNYKVTKAEITNLLLTTDLFYDTLGKQKFRQDVHSMLVKREDSAEVKDSLFSPLIQDIMKQTPKLKRTPVEEVLNNAAKRYSRDAIICQLLARYYISKQDFKQAMDYAKKAKTLSGNNSYICDTIAQIHIRDLKNTFHKDRDDLIKPKNLENYLTLAESATKACKETQQTANKVAEERSQGIYKPYNTAGCLSELQIAVKVIEILKKTQLCKPNDLPSNSRLGQVLTGKTDIQSLAEKDPELQSYRTVLLKYKSLLLNLKDTMKQHFQFLDNFFVNLQPFFAVKDKRKALTLPKVHRCFLEYTDMFCKINCTEPVNNEHLNIKLRAENAQQYLERNKADSYTGLLEYLYKEDSNTVSTLEEIIQHYDFILNLNPRKSRNIRDTVNFIYANVILANISPESKYIKTYQELCNLLLDIIERPTPSSESMSLHYIAVLLLWQEAHPRLPDFVSQLRLSYSKELNKVANGKRAAIHFYLGNEKGYCGLISQRNINRCLKPEQSISTQWDNEKTWNQVSEMNRPKLYRVSGHIWNSVIYTDTSAAEVEVYPMFKSQVRNEPGKTVTFFIGFSVNGLYALDIDFEP